MDQLHDKLHGSVAREDNPWEGKAFKRSHIFPHRISVVRLAIKHRRLHVQRYVLFWPGPAPAFRSLPEPRGGLMWCGVERVWGEWGGVVWMWSREVQWGGAGWGWVGQVG
jgi:hypothetical protein